MKKLRWLRLQGQPKLLAVGVRGFGRRRPSKGSDAHEYKRKAGTRPHRVVSRGRTSTHKSTASYRVWYCSFLCPTKDVQFAVLTRLRAIALQPDVMLAAGCTSQGAPQYDRPCGLFSRVSCIAEPHFEGLANSPACHRLRRSWRPRPAARLHVSREPESFGRPYAFLHFDSTISTCRGLARAAAHRSFHKSGHHFAGLLLIHS